MLQEYLTEDVKQKWKEKLQALCVKLLFWLAVLTLLGLLGWAMYAMLDKDISDSLVEDTVSEDRIAGKFFYYSMCNISLISSSNQV